MKKKIRLLESSDGVKYAREGCGRVGSKETIHTSIQLISRN